MLAPDTTGLAPVDPPSVRRRLAALVYEGLLLFGVMFAATLVFSVVAQARDPLSYRQPLQVLLFVLFGIYFIWSWSHGCTLPMKSWRIRIQDVYGRPVSPRRALARYLLAWIWLLPPLVTGWWFVLSRAEIAVLMVGWILVWALLSRFQPQGQFWHDVWAGTRLVNVPKDAKNTP